MERGMFKKQNKTNCHRLPYNLYSRDLVSYKKKEWSEIPLGGIMSVDSSISFSFFIPG